MIIVIWFYWSRSEIQELLLVMEYCFELERTKNDRKTITEDIETKRNKQINQTKCNVW